MIQVIKTAIYFFIGLLILGVGGFLIFQSDQLNQKSNSRQWPYQINYKAYKISPDKIILRQSATGFYYLNFDDSEFQVNIPYFGDSYQGSFFPESEYKFYPFTEAQSGGQIATDWIYIDDKILPPNSCKEVVVILGYNEEVEQYFSESVAAIYCN